MNLFQAAPLDSIVKAEGKMNLFQAATLDNVVYDGEDESVSSCTIR